jgi:iron(III) transport system substrate-binding protein
MAAGIPAGFKDPEGHWTGLAARARVFIYNRDLLGAEAPPKSLEDLLDPKWKGKVAMARPLTGTTLTNLAALFVVWGEARTKDFVERLLTADIAWQGGNAMVMREVGQGAYVWGFTDTDDANVSIKVKGHPTAVSIPDQGEGAMGTLFIPNSVAILAGARNLENAKKLVDFILSPAVETALAEGPSAQIPLREGLAAPAAFAGIRPMTVDWNKVGPAIEKYEPWLRSRFSGGGERAGDKGSAAAIVIGVLAFVAVAIVIGRKSAVK